MISEQMSQIVAGAVTNRARTAGHAVELEERRRRMSVSSQRMPSPEGVVVEAIDAGGVPCEWNRPPESGDSRMVLYFHGGGYANGGLDSHRKMVGFLALASGMAVLSAGYRLAPEHPFPAAIDDGVGVLTWLLANGTGAKEIVLAGDSSGGGVALATCLAARDRGLPLPDAVVLLSPWVDMAAADPTGGDDAIDDPIVSRANLAELRDWYLVDADPADPLASPLRADLHGLPPTLIQVGERELLGDDARRLHARLVEAGVDARCETWPGMVHAWHAFAGFAPEADAAFAAIAAWLRGLHTSDG